MKAQFKYAFLTGLQTRGYVFAVIFLMNVIFVVFGSLDKFPLAAHIVGVVLCGIAVAVMLAFNIVGDVAVVKRMYSAPEAYIYALTPVPRQKILFAGIIAMFVMDFVSMAVVIFSQVLLSINLFYFLGDGIHIYPWHIIRAVIQEDPAYSFQILWGILLSVAGYFLLITIILFCVTAKQSFLYKTPASGFFAFLLALGCFYVTNLLQIIFAPLGVVDKLGFTYTIILNESAVPLYFLFNLLLAGGFFVLTSKLMERRLNI